ncbi:hypothetical protein CEV34_3541 [Brucella pseudogrignonensis]|jgi:hypothetical protein|uniref:Uncharacterized protein n=1 Tax=Brucella pseudogrignonensis TaxID=419475 RepID=A0A256G8T1_9HYPH|nr:hypothetical protein CEV34_3541 [Brucella pseudogrignonensis]
MAGLRTQDQKPNLYAIFSALYLSHRGFHGDQGAKGAL